MHTSRHANNGLQPRRWLRRGHRWLGIAAAAFALLLATTGIALNHVQDWELDRRYVGWPWLLDAYGIRTPAPAASFADGGHRVTLVGNQLYYDNRPLAAGAGTLAGIVASDTAAVVAYDATVLVLTPGGETIERIDLSAALPGPIERIGEAEGGLVLESGSRLWRGDADSGVFVPLLAVPGARIGWREPSEPTAAELAAIDEAYRGRGLTVERVLADLHSGRIGTVAGTLVMDAAGVLLIVLALTGLLLSVRRNGGHNGRGRP